MGTLPFWGSFSKCQDRARDGRRQDKSAMASEGGTEGSKATREAIAKDIDQLLASSDEEEEPQQKETASGEKETR